MMSLLALLATRHEPWDTLGDLWHPIWLIWWTVIGVPIHAILGWLLSILIGNPIADAVGPFGIAIVLLTILIKLIIAPVFQYQLTTSRRVQAEQRRIAPELAKIRKQYKKDPQRLNQETMALYKEHNINPLAQMSGCLPALVQSPILIALFYVIRDAHSTLHIHDLSFLGISLDKTALQKGQFALAILLPLLAGLTTFVQTKMMTQPGQVQDPTQAAMTQNMTMIMPVFIGFISLQFQTALALYWVVSNLFSIGQQYFITGWGSLSLPPVLRRGKAA
ncbi:MAG TPA: membrane protein insertase YidC [Candidatus Dormibacteraeota bacterium]|nr:membrane protein insertase YidC [Candidatus Dormibacteraeota bacterium]